MPSKQRQRKELLTNKIKQIHEASHQNYGTPKISELLQALGESVSQKTIGNYMRDAQIKAQYVKKYVKTALNSDFSSQLTNLLKRQFNPNQPDSYWCSDITYIWTKEDGFVYLTSIMDLYSRKIISWQVTNTLEVSCVVRCVEDAKRTRQVNQPIVIHSDRGSQYVSEKYKQALGTLFQLSYSKKGTPWDNACIESFHALIKREWLNRAQILTLADAKRLVFEYIETFYNTVRIHSACGYVSPTQFEKAYLNSLKSSPIKLFNEGRFAVNREKKTVQ